MKNDDTTNQPDKKDRQAAANIIRGDLERIYSGDDAPHAQAEQEIRQQHASESAKQNRTAPDVHNDYTEEWKHYHNSWSSYYQQYYERYYLNHLHRAKQNIKKTEITSTPNQTGVIGSLEPSMDSQENLAVNELRDQLLSTVKDQADKVKKSRHYAPIMTAVVFALVFLFLQYNQFMFATVRAYVSPGSIDPQNIILDPSDSTKVGQEPKLIIPKINVEAPVIYGVNPLDNNSVENHLRDGVVHYPIANAASVPGQNGATTILGHSSMDVFDDGKYKFVFVQLNKLNVGDNFYINYQGTRYTYSITKKEIIDPKDIAKVAPPDIAKPSVILITCDPPGTAVHRLLVFADQVSPDPSKAQKASINTQQNSNNQTIRGYSPSTLERLFGIR